MVNNVLFINNNYNAKSHRVASKCLVTENKYMLNIILHMHKVNF